MIEPIALQRLLAWLSPAFPIGSFAWSGGLETAIVNRDVTSAEATRNWILGSLQAGSIATDAILLAHAYRQPADPEALEAIADLALALSASAERHAEIVSMGNAFVLAAAAWPTPVLAHLPRPCPYPVALGAAAAGHDIPLPATLLAFVAAAVQAQVSVAVRLVPIGQTAGLQVVAGLEGSITAVARDAACAELEDIGSIAYATDIAQMRHEELQPRLFRS